jgi:20S proteasome alpha/beta subunit
MTIAIALKVGDCVVFGADRKHYYSMELNPELP